MTHTTNTPLGQAEILSQSTVSDSPERVAKVLVIGAGGNVSRHSVPLLVQQGHEVTGLVRNPDHVSRIEKAGARAEVQDITELTVEQWAALLSKFDVVVWSAGAGGGSAERTYAVDRDAALRVVEALERLTEHTPRLLMVSYAGARFATTEDDGGSWFAYVEAKKAVDLRIMESDLEQVILGPGMLVDGAVAGYATINLDAATQEHPKTSRELVAEVIVELTGRESVADIENPFEFQNGETPVREIGH